MVEKRKWYRTILDFVNRNRFYCSILLILFACAAMIVPCFFLELPWIGLEITTDIQLVVALSQIVSAVFVIVGTVIAVWQYYLSSSKSLRELEISRVEKAIELSNYYKDNILDRYSFVRFIFSACGIIELLEAKRKSCEIKEFDILELERLYTKEEIEKFQNLKNDPVFVETVLKASLSSNIGLGDPVEIVGCDGKIVKLHKNQKQVIVDFFNIYITQMLNNAEYFAMAFTHNIADESVIYQSIYPTFLEMCFVLYYYIAERSDPAKAKLYTNIAELYRVWRNREQEQLKEHEEGVRKGSKKMGTVVKTNI